MRQAEHLKFGATCETMACDFYFTHGYTLLKRNFRCDVGEIDLILQKDEQLVFAEVRGRKTTNFMHPLESISARKVARIRRAAEWFVAEQALSNYYCRFDIVAISPATENHTRLQLEYFCGAF